MQTNACPRSRHEEETDPAAGEPLKAPTCVKPWLDAILLDILISMFTLLLHVCVFEDDVEGQF